MTFGKYAEKYLSEKKKEVRPQTMAAYKVKCKPLYEEFGETELADIDIPMIRAYAKKRCEKYAPKTVSLEIVLFKTILNTAAEERLCPALPQFSVHLPLIVREYRLLTDEEFDRLYSYCTKRHDYACTGTLIGMNTGMRIGEICALKKSDIDFNNCVISVTKTTSTWSDPDTHKYHCEVGVTKTPAGRRRIPITHEFAAILYRRLERKKPDEYVLGFQNKHADPSAFRYAYNRILEHLGIEHVKFHNLRHGFATRMIERGVDPKTAAAFLGHANCNTTLNIYTNCTEKMKRDALEKIWSDAR